MTSKFFTLASSWLLPVFVLSFSTVQSATPAPKLGYIRFWNMLPPANGPLEVRKIGGGESEASMLNGSPYQYLSYIDFPLAKYRLGIFKRGDRNNPLGVVDVDLRADTFFTILASPQSGRLNIEVINDTNDPKTTVGTLTVRNYFNGLTVDVSSQTQKMAEGLSYGQSRSVTGLPLSILPLTLRFHLVSGQPAESGAEADLHISKRATLLIVPDYKGRFCARVTIDGKNP